MPNLLRLRLKPDTDGSGELFAEVHAGPFSGAASAWFGLSELAEFGRLMRDTFPLAPGQCLKLEGGAWAKTGTPAIEDLHLGIQVVPLGSLGAVRVRVQLATALADNNDSGDGRCAVQAELASTYEQLRCFGEAVMALAHGSGEFALLAVGEGP